MKLLLSTDGGSRGNPGPAAYGYVIQDISGSPAEALAKEGAGKILEKCGNYLGVTTNNQAEYAGLINGLKWVVQNYPNTYLRIQMDSLLIVSQVKGDYKVKHPDILPRYLEAMDLLGKLKSYTILYVPRVENALADSLVNAALDSQT